MRSARAESGSTWCSYKRVDLKNQFHDQALCTHSGSCCIVALFCGCVAQRCAACRPPHAGCPHLLLHHLEAKLRVVSRPHSGLRSKVCIATQSVSLGRCRACLFHCVQQRPRSLIYQSSSFLRFTTPTTTPFSFIILSGNGSRYPGTLSLSPTLHSPVSCQLS